jgi:hypothetical protein
MGLNHPAFAMSVLHFDIFPFFSSFDNISNIFKSFFTPFNAFFIILIGLGQES